ncbi:MAG: hypothetical protein ACOYM2_12740, partial [Rectinemataceae bacterium]
QIKADVIGVPFERSPIGESGTLGAALIAAVAVGELASYEEAVERFVRPGELFEPDAARHAVYIEKYESYAQLFPRLSDLLVRPAGK